MNPRIVADRSISSRKTDHDNQHFTNVLSNVVRFDYFQILAKVLSTSYIEIARLFAGFATATHPTGYE